MSARLPEDHWLAKDIQPRLAYIADLVLKKFGKKRRDIDMTQSNHNQI